VPINFQERKSKNDKRSESKNNVDGESKREKEKAIVGHRNG
jgi:hypothetical protein